MKITAHTRIDPVYTDGIDTIGYIDEAPAQWRGDTPTQDSMFLAIAGDEVEIGQQLWELGHNGEWQRIG